MKKIWIFYLLALLLLVFLFIKSCKGSAESNNTQIYKNVAEFSEGILDSIIQNTDTVAIFGATEWCGASADELQELINIYQSNKEKHGGIALVVLFYGTAENIAAVLKSQNVDYQTYRIANSWSGFDKMRYNKFFKKHFKNFRSQDYVPYNILINRDKEVLNYNETEKRYEYVKIYFE